MASELDATDLAHTRTGGGERAGGPELAAGARLGHFRIDQKLGAGGMGEVYLATDLALDRHVAIKVLPAGTTSAAARDRMIREARAQARVHHSNVAHIYFIGEDEGRLYFAMEYLAGKTLAEQIAAKPLPIEDALTVIRAAALGLREAERAGFLHRDVKPSNLMVDEHGVLKVLDFGLVAAGLDPSTDGPVAQTSLGGTPLYMAPEQARGEPIDLRADIYALGATLYHLISGKPPFAGDTVAELVTQHATAIRPLVPRGVQPRVAATALDGLIARMMAPSRADRFASYDELLRALDLLSAQRTRPAGFLVRLAATSIDIFLAAALAGLAELPFGDKDDDMWFVAVMFGVLTIVGLAWRGTTPGKAMFELDVVSVDTGARPRRREASLRQLALVVPVIALAVGRPLLVGWPRVVTSIPLFAFMIYGLVDLAYAAWRRVGKRTWWDRVSHTQVRYRPSRQSPGPLVP